ncbi:NAD(P)-dependent dehydrogenase, short-chain alcohol dehydrogenase family [Micromonospora nigra]|uniref:NAD(P)-dependent dehydrogenase, short-chain alcohol dehydrogenase family n=1 Tax=Micromonospora nigra TaxID=145857 RepID=A0A1C6SJ19_9ACTN|nr:oxidoreductase [Micromonospora nigra]SCL29387.1 NAD(P)-dependent dehydrogenase, short-chain alcohol dehydrogenase family [Micromonospora nigra]
MRPDPTTPPWTIDDVPDLDGRTVLVTGANTGIGRATALALAARGAHVVLACRDAGRADAARVAIGAAAPRGTVTTLPLDLASLDSVRRAAGQFRARHDRLDVLVNNAGVMTLTGGVRWTRDGFEQHLGINHLGHFALTGLLLEPLLAAPAGRVVQVSSLSQAGARIDRADPHWRTRRYRPFRAYGASKLANLLAAYRLHELLAAGGARAVALAAHPGACRTEISRDGPPWLRLLELPGLRWCTSWLTHEVAAAALPTVRAATDPAARGGDVYGPDGWRGLTGRPVRVDPGAGARDEAARRWLWEMSEEATGVTYRVTSP